MKNYDESQVVRSLQNKNDLEIDTRKKVIVQLHENRAKCDVGIGSRGKISYLKNFCGYISIWVTDFKEHFNSN